jgi:rubrerythrin
MQDLISLIYRGLQSEYEAVQIYKEVANSARQLEQNEVAAQFDEIASDEMEHIGNLTELLKIYLPQDYKELQDKMESGYKEVQEDLKKYDSGEATSINSARLKTYTDYLRTLNSDVEFHNKGTYTELVISKASLNTPTL